jgi:hypothetical protein
MDENTVGKIISIAGIRRGDIVLYLASLIAAKNEPVLVVDNSTQHAVFRFASGSESGDEAYLENISFIYDAVFDEKLTEHFPYIIVYHEMNVNREWWDESDSRIMVTDFDKFNLDDIHEATKDMVLDDLILMVTNRFSGKINEKYVAATLHLPRAALEDVLEIQPEPEIESARIALQYNRMTNLTKLPKSLKMTLFNLYMRVMQPDGKVKMNSLFSSAAAMSR